MWDHIQSHKGAGMVDGSTQLSLTMLEAGPLPLALLHRWGGRGKQRCTPFSLKSQRPCLFRASRAESVEAVRTKACEGVA